MLYENITKQIEIDTESERKRERYISCMFVIVAVFVVIVSSDFCQLMTITIFTELTFYLICGKATNLI